MIRKLSFILLFTFFISIPFNLMGKDLKKKKNPKNDEISEKYIFWTYDIILTVWCLDSRWTRFPKRDFNSWSKNELFFRIK